MTYQDQRSLFALMALIEDRLDIASSKTNEEDDEWGDVRMGDITKGLCQINEHREQRGLLRQQSQTLLIEEKAMPKQDPPMQQYQDCEELREYDDNMKPLFTWRKCQYNSMFRRLVDNNAYHTVVTPYVDKALISDTEPSWNIDLSRKIIMAHDVFIKAITSYTIGVIIGFVIIGAFMMLLR
jgi:hypothetical protein